MIEKYGNIIRFHRKKSGLTLAELAHYAGVSKTLIFNMEHNKPSIQLDTLVKVLNILDIEIVFKSSLMDQYEEFINEKS